jgi:hypothetical protein
MRSSPWIVSDDSGSPYAGLVADAARPVKHPQFLKSLNIAALAGFSTVDNP